jgi:hypothetical protein
MVLRIETKKEEKRSREFLVWFHKEKHTPQRTEEEKLCVCV